MLCIDYKRVCKLLNATRFFNKLSKLINVSQFLVQKSIFVKKRQEIKSVLRKLHASKLYVGDFWTEAAKVPTYTNSIVFFCVNYNK